MKSRTDSIHIAHRDQLSKLTSSKWDGDVPLGIKQHQTLMEMLLQWEPPPIVLKTDRGPRNMSLWNVLYQQLTVPSETRLQSL